MTFIVPNAVLTFEGQSVELNERQISHIARLVKDDLPRLNGHETTDGHKTVVALREISANMEKWINQRMCASPVIRKLELTFENARAVGNDWVEDNLYTSLGSVPTLEESIVGVRITAVHVKVGNVGTLQMETRDTFEKGPTGRPYNYATSGRVNGTEYHVAGACDYERGTLRLSASDNVAAIDLEVDFVRISNPVEIGAIRIDRSEIEYLKQNPEARKQLLSLLGVPTKMGEFYRDTIVDEVEVSTNAPVETLTIDFEAYEGEYPSGVGTVKLPRPARSLTLRKINSQLLENGGVRDPLGPIHACQFGGIMLTAVVSEDRELLKYERSQMVKTAEFDVVYYGPGIVDTGVTHVDTYRL